MKVLLCGCGIWGRKILRILLDASIQPGVLDPNKEAREQALSEGACEAFDEPGECASHSWEAAIVATPASTHREVMDHLLGFLPREAPILCEKPLTTSVAESEDIFHKAGTRVFVDHTWRYHPGIQTLGRLAREGVLGEITSLHSVRVNWTSPRKDVDTIWNMVPHDITLALEILGKIPTPRWAVADVQERIARGMIGCLGSRPWFVFESSNLYADKRREVRLHGTEGTAVLSSVDSQSVQIFRPGEKGTVARKDLAFPHVDPLREQILGFLRYTHGSGPRPLSDAREGLEVVRCVSQLRNLAGLE